MRKRCLWILALCLCLLTGCGGDKWENGEIVEYIRDEDGKLTAFIMENTDGKQVGVRLTEETAAFPFRDMFTKENFLYEEPAGIVVSVWPGGRAEKLVTENGKKIRTYDVKAVHIEELLTPNALTLSDGTPVGVWSGRWNENRYVLADGTELLREKEPFGPANVHVGGLEGFNDLSETAKNAILTYYEEQGTLYDLDAELEHAYAAYQAHEGETEFSSFWVGQDTSPSASNERLMYFQTTLMLPLDEQMGEERQCGDIFDRETGERIDVRDLFTCGEAEAKAAVLKACGVYEYYGDTPGLAESMAANFTWEHLVFSSEDLWYYYPAGSLLGEEGGYVLSTEYDQLADVLHPWAIPEAYEPEA